MRALLLLDQGTEKDSWREVVEVALKLRERTVCPLDIALSKRNRRIQIVRDWRVLSDPLDSLCIGLRPLHITGGQQSTRARDQRRRSFWSKVHRPIKGDKRRLFVTLGKRDFTAKHPAGREIGFPDNDLIKLISGSNVVPTPDVNLRETEMAFNTARIDLEAFFVCRFGFIEPLQR